MGFCLAALGRVLGGGREGFVMKRLAVYTGLRAVVSFDQGWRNRGGFMRKVWVPLQMQPR